MMRVLITGGSGFVGSWLQRMEPENIHGIYLNHKLYDAEMWMKMSFDYIIHAAPVSPIRALEHAQYYGERLLYISSGVVYHPESDKIQYRQDKLDGENECLSSGLNVSIARLFTFNGFNVHKTLFDAAREGRPLEIWGDTTRSFMHGSQMGRTLWSILLRGERGKCYDVGSTKPVTVLRLAERIKALCDTPSEIKFVDKFVPMPVYLPEDAKKTEQLNSERVKA